MEEYWGGKEPAVQQEDVEKEGVRENQPKLNVYGNLQRNLLLCMLT